MNISTQELNAYLGNEKITFAVSFCQNVQTFLKPSAQVILCGKPNLCEWCTSKSLPTLIAFLQKGW